jgi:hypothetical protein
MPFFGTELAPDRVRINGYSQAILDQEIEFAAYAGLDYWAFDAYAPDNAMSNALRLYLSSKAKDKMKFCMLADIGVLANRTMLGWHRELMKDASYQQVLDGRPLYYLLMPNAAAIERIGGRGRAKELVDGARTDASLGGGHNPYIVLLNQNPSLAAEAARALGCDAIGSYAVNRNLHRAPFAELVREAEELWEQFAATGLPVIPPVTTGFDRRPRAEHPVPWEGQSASPSVASAIYYGKATPDEIGRELRDCLRWMKSHPAAVPANTALIYAWNEYDEGGWLAPTYPNDRSRLEAVRRVLRGGG